MTKKTKLTLPLLALLTIVLNSYSQTRVGISAGINFSNIEQTKNKSPVKTSIRTGYRVGANIETPISKEFYIEPGLLFTTKGFNKGDAVKMDAKAYYLELPINIIYKSQLGNGKLLLGAGPYMGYGLGGKWKTPANDNGTQYITGMEGNLQFVNDTKADNYYSIWGGSKFTYGKPFDFGANFLAGYEFFNRFSVQVNSQLGLLNISPKVDGKKTNDQLKNLSFSIALGYHL
ncbi:MAG: porin family protein [Niabella sp.]